MSVQAFNDMLREFLGELSATFPECRGVRAYVAGFEALVAVNARKPLDLFMAALGPHAALIQAKDPALFVHDLFPGSGIDMRALWATDITPATRDAIWQYIQMLYMLGTTVSLLPPELLTSIESVAGDLAQKMAAGGPGGIDASAISGAVQSLFPAFGPGGPAGGGGGLGAGLLGMLGPMLGGDAGGGEIAEDLSRLLESAPGSGGATGGSDGPAKKKKRRR